MSTTTQTAAGVDGSLSVRAAALYRSAILTRAQLVNAAIERFDAAEEADDREKAAAQLLAAVLIGDARYDTDTATIADHLVQFPGGQPQPEGEVES